MSRVVDGQPDIIDQDGPSRTQAARLAAAVDAFRSARFAVVDGAQFTDLPAWFARNRLRARSLFLGHADDEIERAGPWLVPLDQQAGATGKVVAFVGAKPAAVFWSCGGGETVLFQHLRTLNMSRIPDWAANGGKAPAEARSTYETVFFRHFDPSVLGALLPVLDALQFARFIGPADEIAFHAADYGGLRRVLPAHDGPAPPGLLTIRSEQMQALSQRRLAASRDRIASYLRRVVPDIAPKLAADDLRRFVEDSGRSGRELGIRTEAGHCRWAYLMMMSEGRILQKPEALAFIRQGDHAPDHQVKALLGHLRHYLKYDAPRDLREPA